MSTRNRRIVIAVFCLGLAALLYCAVARDRLVQVDSGFRVIMGTFSRVIVVARDSRTAAACIEAAFKEQQRVDVLMSSYRDDSELSEVNRDARNEPVEVSAATFEILAKAIAFSELSGGAFDVTIGPLTDLWRSAGEANSIPTEAELLSARSKVGYEKLILDANETTVRFAAEGMKLDLGGIAKGYAIDKSVEVIKRCGAVAGMVDIGGDIRCFGAPAGKRDKWLIGLQDPNVAADDLDQGKYLFALQLADGAIATSGGYRRFTLVRGERQSHIIDTKSGRGTDKLASVTVIAKDAITADALATAVSVLGPQKGMALIERLPGTEAILISPAPNYDITETAGAGRYIGVDPRLTAQGKPEG